MKLFFSHIDRFVTHRSEILALLNVKYQRRHPKGIQFISTLWVCRKAYNRFTLTSFNAAFFPLSHTHTYITSEPLTSVIGGPDIFVNFGSTINLTCIVKNSPESPFMMYWTHNNIVSWLMKSNKSHYSQCSDLLLLACLSWHQSNFLIKANCSFELWAIAVEIN